MSRRPSTRSSKRRIDGGRLDAAGLVLVAKILSDSGWSVPDSLKPRLVDMLENSSLGSARPARAT